MANKLTHFAIYIDDIDRAKSFYRDVFQWGFQSYGPDDFLQIKSDDSESGELIGALQSRKYAPLPEKIIGFECTIQVPDSILKAEAKLYSLAEERTQRLTHSTCSRHRPTFE